MSLFEKYADDILEGERFVSRGRTITESDVVMFCALSGDWYPLHSNREWAAKSPFGERIAHGLLILVVGAAFMPIMPGVVIAFYGIDKVRFTNPVRFGDTIHSEFEVIGKEDRDEDKSVITLDVTIANQNDKPVVKAIFKLLCNRHVPRGK